MAAEQLFWIASAAPLEYDDISLRGFRHDIPAQSRSCQDFAHLLSVPRHPARSTQ
ncbi:MAG TPA: hypothetical protein VJX94_26425 [Stellaceae bacterium]|nr:hypothetical protein [Stellaceae bacterium]